MLSAACVNTVQFNQSIKIRVFAGSAGSDSYNVLSLFLSKMSFLTSASSFVPSSL